MVCMVLVAVLAYAVPAAVSVVRNPGSWFGVRDAAVSVAGWSALVSALVVCVGWVIGWV